MKDKQSPKICIVCSGGGHLAECMLITEGLKYDKYFVTFYSPHLQETLRNHRYYIVINPYRNVFRFIINFCQSLRIFFKERPDFVITNGASVVICTCLIAKLLRKKVIFVTPAAGPFTPCATGRFVCRFADLFIVSWKPLLRYYKNGIYVGDFFI